MLDNELGKDKNFDQIVKGLQRKLKEFKDGFGGVNDDIALPSMRKVLFNVFKMNAVCAHYLVHRMGKSIELNAFAYNNDSAIIVLVGGDLQYEHMERLLNLLKVVREFLPEYATKKIYGILAMNDDPEQFKDEVLKRGIYYAEIYNDLFEVKTPANFKARAF